ncbi:hypothetical protein D3C71_1247260 [compost metagenome]
MEERRVHYIACTRAKEKLTIFTSMGKESDFLKECDFSVVNVYEESGISVGKPVFKKQKPPEEGVALDTLLRQYIADIHGTYSITDEKLLNMEFVLSNFSFEYLVSQFEAMYGAFLLTNPGESKGCLESFFSAAYASIVSQVEQQL